MSWCPSPPDTTGQPSFLTFDDTKLQDVNIDNTAHTWNTQCTVDSSASYYDEDFHDRDNSKVLNCLLVDYSCTGSPSLRNSILLSIHDRLLKRARPCFPFEDETTTTTTTIKQPRQLAMSWCPSPPDTTGQPSFLTFDDTKLQDVNIDNTAHTWNTQCTVDSSASYYDEDFHDRDNSKVLNCLLVDYSCTGSPSLRNSILLSIHDRLLKRARPCFPFEDKTTTTTTIKQPRQLATKQIRVKIDIDRVIHKCCYSIDGGLEKLKKANMDIPEIMRVCRSNAMLPSDDSVTSLETFLPEMITTDVRTIPPSDGSVVS